MKRSSLVALVGLFACSDTSFGHVQTSPRLEVHLVKEDDEAVVGSRVKPLELAINAPQTFRLVVRALDESGAVDKSFNGFVRISAKPGAIESIDSPDADGRNLNLTAGESAEVDVKLTNAYGTTFIVADDLGYQPGDPLSKPPPACSDGVDNDGDDRIDFPADEGCAFANDTTETGGSYAQGASHPIYYRLPRVADVRGVQCVDPANPDTCSSPGATPYPKEQLQIATGYDEDNNVFGFDLVVTRISTDGFYVADTKDPRGSFNSVFAFNFSSPPNMRVCDRLKSFAGTASEFFGFTQINYPTWTLEEWNPEKRPCLVPEPTVLEPLLICPPRSDGTGCDDPKIARYSGGLVRVLSSGTALTVKVTPKFGAGFVPQKSGIFVPSADATNCDLNKDGNVSFDPQPDGSANPEGVCNDACTKDPECTEYSNYVGRSTFRLTVTDDKGHSGAIQADATTAADFNPFERRGQQLRSFSGTLNYFSGGNQYTIEARCKDDIVVDLNATPLPADKACVFQRTDFEDTSQ